MGDSGPLALAELPNHDLVIGGIYRGAYSFPMAANIVRWDGTAGHELGAGLNSAVKGLLAEPSGELLAVASFTNAGGNPDADYIALWNGNAWVPFGPRLNGPVYDIDVLDPGAGNFIITGDFTDAGGDPNADRLAQWDGTGNWQSIDHAGLDSTGIEVHALSDNSVLVGGLFSNLRFDSWGLPLPSERLGWYKSIVTGTAPAIDQPVAHLWPNPATTQLHVQLRQPTTTLRLFDATGRMVRHFTPTSALVTLEVADLPRGLYWLRAASGAGQCFVLD